MGWSSLLHLIVLAVGLFLAHELGFFFQLVRTLSLLFVFFVGMIYHKQDQMLYVPIPGSQLRDSSVSPGKFNMPYEDVYITSEDGTSLHGWFIKRSTDEATRNAHTIVYYHANAGGIIDRLPLFLQLWQALDVNILAAEYRGYGNCSGTPSEAGIKEDSVAYYRFAAEHDLVDNSRIVVFGRSLGGAVAVSLTSRIEESHSSPKEEGNNSLASLPKPAALVIENTFTSVADIAVVVLPILRPIHSILRPPFLSNIWDSLHKIPLVHSPILFFSGLQDELIPPTQMRALYQTSGNSKLNTFCTVAHGGHNDTVLCAGEDYYKVLGQFLGLLQNPELHEDWKVSIAIDNQLLRHRNLSTTSEESFWGARF